MFGRGIEESLARARVEGLNLGVGWGKTGTPAIPVLVVGSLEIESHTLSHSQNVDLGSSEAC